MKPSGPVSTSPSGLLPLAGTPPAPSDTRPSATSLRAPTATPREAEILRRVEAETGEPVHAHIQVHDVHLFLEYHHESFLKPMVDFGVVTVSETTDEMRLFAVRMPLNLVPDQNSMILTAVAAKLMDRAMKDKLLVRVPRKLLRAMKIKSVRRPK